MMCLCVLLKCFIIAQLYLLNKIIHLLCGNGAPKLTSAYGTDKVLGQEVFTSIQCLFLHLLVSLFTAIFVYKYQYHFC